MKKLLKLYDEQFVEKVNQPRAKLIRNALKGKDRKRSFTDTLGFGIVDYKEVYLVNENSIEINPNPRMFNPYRGSGRIYMSFEAGEIAQETVIKGEIKPYNKSYIVALYSVLVFLIFWTVLSFIIDKSTNTLFTVLIGWALFSLLMLTFPLWSRSRLREYKRSFIDNLESDSLQ